MLDIKTIRENPLAVEENLKRRQDPEIIRKFHKFLDIDKTYLELLNKIQNLRHERNKLSKEITTFLRDRKKFSELSKKAKNLDKKIKELESKLREISLERRNLLLQIPNLLHKDVPFGKSEADNKVIKEFGKKPKFSFKPLSHVEMIKNLNLVDLERAAKISQSRFYFLKGKLALLDLALCKYAIDFLNERGFTFLIPPHLMNRFHYEGVTSLEDFENVMYKVENEDLYLIATSEHPLIAMHSNEIFNEEELPIKYSAFSVNFRKEAGTHIKQEKGIWRVHQFNKIEQIILSKQEESWKFFDELINNTIEFFSSLEIPFRQVEVCTADIGIVASRKYDLEAWIPSAKKYMEIASCSNCTDYQANRLKIRYKLKNGTKKAVHTLNSTCVATTRAIVAILENFQQEDGSIKMPKILHKYCGFKEIP